MIVEDEVPLATTGVVPVMVELAGSAVGVVKTTSPSDFETGETIDRVFVSAVNELRVQVEIPDVLVREHDP